MVLHSMCGPTEKDYEFELDELNQLNDTNEQNDELRGLRWYFLDSFFFF